MDINIAFRAAKTVPASEYPYNTPWGEWMRKNARLCEVVKGELCTFVRVSGLNYLSEALRVFKSSPEYSEMRDCTFVNCKLSVAYANDFKH